MNWKQKMKYGLILKIDTNFITFVEIQCNDPDTIYLVTPHQHHIQLISWIAVTISLWTTFSIVSMYAYRKLSVKQIYGKSNKIINNFSVNQNNEEFATKIMEIVKKKSKKWFLKKLISLNFKSIKYVLINVN